MSELERQLVAIEADVDTGRYRTGPSDRFVRELCARPRSERLALAPDVSRVSRKLHDRQHRRTVLLRARRAREALGTAVGGAAVAICLATGSALLIAAAFIWVTTLESLLKVGVGGATRTAPWVQTK